MLVHTVLNCFGHFSPDPELPEGCKIKCCIDNPPQTIVSGPCIDTNKEYADRGVFRFLEAVRVLAKKQGFKIVVSAYSEEFNNE